VQAAVGSGAATSLNAAAEPQTGRLHAGLNRPRQKFSRVIGLFSTQLAPGHN
jgi:hypothetical protein